jgi:hypothetical protein
VLGVQLGGGGGRSVSHTGWTALGSSSYRGRELEYGEEKRWELADGLPSE